LAQAAQLSGRDAEAARYREQLQSLNDFNQGAALE
jgi:hypothetical protein